MTDDLTMKIYLVGLPGSGKSTLGKGLAKKLDLPYFDLDVEIVNKEGKSINEIFSQDGEPYFREVEARVLREVSEAHSQFLISTGGGTPCFHANMVYINSNGLSIFLDVPCEEIIRRLLANGIEERPLLKEIPKEKLIEELEGKRKARIDDYSKAKFQFTGNLITEELILSKIKRA